MSRFIRRSLLALTAVALLSTAGLSVAQAQPKNPNDAAAPAASAGPSLEQLLDAAGFAYSKQTFDDGNVAYRITVEANGEVSIVVASERTMGWKDSKGNDVKLVYIWTTITPVADGVELPASMLKRIAELNDQYLIGGVSAPKGGVYYCNSFWLRTADPEILADELVLAHNSRLSLRKELLPYMSEN
ncbi:MAG: hypothetical protein KF708_18345 [Pirellulales bacterium]|nr:hypothetical protein [Pirellulales bacterium]